MAQNLRTRQLFLMPNTNQQNTTYEQAKKKLENLKKYSKKLLEIMEGKCSILWTGVLTDLWDEIDHSNQLTSWDFKEHMSDYHRLEDGCDCFSEISDSIVKEIIRLLLCTSFESVLEQESTSSYNLNGPPCKKRKLE